MLDYCPHCAMRSIEAARERDEFTRTLAAIVHSAGGEIRVSDVSIAFSGEPNVPDIEIFEDKDNRCTVVRTVRPLPVGRLPMAMLPNRGPIQTLMTPKPVAPRISGNLADRVTDSMRPE